MKMAVTFCLWVTAVAFFFSSLAKAAEIRVTSGEILEGDILSIQDSRMILGCSWGEASVGLEAVKEIYFVPQEERISTKGLLLKDGANLLGAQLTGKDQDGFVFSLPYGRLILTDALELSYLNLRDPGELILPDRLQIGSAHVLLRSRGDFVQEKIVGELVQYEAGSFRVRTDHGVLGVPEAAVRGISFTGRVPSLERLGLKIWEDLPIRGKPISFADGAWKITAPFGVFLIDIYGLIQEITYPPSALSPPEEAMMFISLLDGTDLWGNILAWQEKEATFSTDYGSLSLPAREILRISSISAARSSHSAPKIL